MTYSNCPLCNSGLNYQKTIDYSLERAYVSCSHCGLVYVPQRHHLSPPDEKAIYDFHENNPNDEGYRRFLRKLGDPLMQRLAPKSQGLDFGCGPGPTLSRLFEEQDFSMSDFDPIYQNHIDLLEQTYDFVCATEVVEHFREPSTSFDQMMKMIRPKGYLGLMTKLNPEPSVFSAWHYTRDTTHISFYREKTMHYLADRYDCALEILGHDVIILKKRG